MFKSPPITSIITCFMFLLFNVFSCSSNDKSDNQEQVETPKNISTTPLFTNSIVSTDIDFIKQEDTDAFKSIEYLGTFNKEMPDSRTDNLFDTGTFVFKVNFTNNNTMEIWAHSSFGSIVAAQEYAKKITPRLGKLPHVLRDKLSHVVLHKGDATAFAESEANFFVVYSENIDLRISNNDFEETVFHESIHASLDATYLNNNLWLEAQKKDNGFITEYARNNADKEDLAETALFVYTLLKHPERLSKNTKDWMLANVPNRVKFITGIFQE